MTIFIIAIVAILVALIAMRLFSRTKSVTSSMRTTRDRRSGHDRRQRRAPIRRERRRRPRREEDVARDYMAKLDLKRTMTASPPVSHQVTK
jgi:hypothetical protein